MIKSDSKSDGSQAAFSTAKVYNAENDPSQNNIDNLSMVIDLETPDVNLGLEHRWQVTNTSNDLEMNPYFADVQFTVEAMPDLSLTVDIEAPESEGEAIQEIFEAESKNVTHHVFQKTPDDLVLSLDGFVEMDEVLHLYQANNWSSATKPQALLAALRNSHRLVTARIKGELIGVGNAISDGHLVAYFSHLLVLPEYQNHGIGRVIMDTLLAQYEGFHQIMLISDIGSVNFYRRQGFECASKTMPMWIFEDKNGEYE